MRALVFSNISPRELNGKFVRLVNDRGLSLEKVVPCKRALEVDMSADFIIATIEGTTEGDRKNLEHAAGQWGKRIHWVPLRAAHPNWEALARATKEAHDEQEAEMSNNDWQRLAEKYAEENDQLRARCATLTEQVSGLQVQVKKLEGAAAERRADRERAEKLTADLEKANADAASLRKRLTDAIDARGKAETALSEARTESRRMPVARPANGAESAIFSLLDAGLMTPDEAIGKLRAARG